MTTGYEQYYNPETSESTRHLTTEGYTKANALIQAILAADSDAARGQARQELYDFSYILLERCVAREFALAKQQYLLSNHEMNPAERESLLQHLRQESLQILQDAVSHIHNGEAGITLWKEYSQRVASRVKQVLTRKLEKMMRQEEEVPLSTRLSRELAAPESLEDGLHDMERKEMVADALGSLTDRERIVIELLYGLGDGYEYTQKDAARIIGRSDARVQQIEAKALCKLRQAGTTMYTENVSSRMAAEEEQQEPGGRQKQKSGNARG